MILPSSFQPFAFEAMSEIVGGVMLVQSCMHFGKEQPCSNAVRAAEAKRAHAHAGVSLPGARPAPPLPLPLPPPPPHVPVRRLAAGGCARAGRQGAARSHRASLNVM